MTGDYHLEDQSNTEPPSSPHRPSLFPKSTRPSVPSELPESAIRPARPLTAILAATVRVGFKLHPVPPPPGESELVNDDKKGNKKGSRK